MHQLESLKSENGGDNSDLLGELNSNIAPVFKTAAIEFAPFTG
jgi:hypothetical protein